MPGPYTFCIFRLAPSSSFYPRRRSCVWRLQLEPEFTIKQKQKTQSNTQSVCFNSKARNTKKFTICLLSRFLPKPRLEAKGSSVFIAGDSDIYFFSSRYLSKMQLNIRLHSGPEHPLQYHTEGSDTCVLGACLGMLVFLCLIFCVFFMQWVCLCSTRPLKPCPQFVFGTVVALI